ncbi:MAG: class I SAM-dependent methyltransferase [Candidatus Electrothrix sp. EH2]|nr:class I SAM-dependent methyltransferase [Candidatus Electrothrix sp. EH2]
MIFFINNNTMRRIFTMSSQDSSGFDVIKESHKLSGDPDELAQYYQQWADRYDDDVSKEEYAGPDYIADYFEAMQKKSDRGNRDIKILDAGCGSGLVGITLYRKEYRDIDGCDLSHEMVSLAEKTDCYQKVVGGVDLNDMSSFHDKEYDAVISCGVFTLGHVPPQALNELIRITKSGGLIVLSTRTSYYESSGFHEFCDSLEEQKLLKILDHRIGPYIAEEDAHYWAFIVP